MKQEPIITREPTPTGNEPVDPQVERAKGVTCKFIDFDKRPCTREAGHGGLHETGVAPTSTTKAEGCEGTVDHYLVPSTSGAVGYGTEEYGGSACTNKLVYRINPKTLVRLEQLVEVGEQTLIFAFSPVTDGQTCPHCKTLNPADQGVDGTFDCTGCNTPFQVPSEPDNYPPFDLPLRFYETVQASPPDIFVVDANDRTVARCTFRQAAEWLVTTANAHSLEAQGIFPTNVNDEPTGDIFTEPAAPRFAGFSRINALIAALVLLLVLIGFAPIIGRAQQTANPPQQTEQKQYKKDGSEVHYCGAPTKAGGKCRRHVKKEGDRCFMHVGK